jgi:hypothetical protein
LLNVEGDVESKFREVMGIEQVGARAAAGRAAGRSSAAQMLQVKKQEEEEAAAAAVEAGMSTGGGVGGSTRRRGKSAQMQVADDDIIEVAGLTRPIKRQRNREPTYSDEEEYTEPLAPSTVTPGTRRSTRARTKTKIEPGMYDDDDDDDDDDDAGAGPPALESSPHSQMLSQGPRSLPIPRATPTVTQAAAAGYGDGEDSSDLEIVDVRVGKGGKRTPAKVKAEPAAEAPKRGRGKAGSKASNKATTTATPAAADSVPVKREGIPLAPTVTGPGSVATGPVRARIKKSPSLAFDAAGGGWVDPSTGSKTAGKSGVHVHSHSSSSGRQGGSLYPPAELEDCGCYHDPSDPRNQGNFEPDEAAALVRAAKKRVAGEDDEEYDIED